MDESPILIMNNGRVLKIFAIDTLLSVYNSSKGMPHRNLHSYIMAVDGTQFIPFWAPKMWTKRCDIFSYPVKC